MATGWVTTGFSKPYIALYSATGGVVNYTSGMPLARGVSVELELDEGNDNNFYADNVTAETSPGLFTGGTVTLTVDGLKAAAQKLALGMPEPKTVTVDGKQVNVTAFGDGMQIPYVGIGFIVRHMEDGVTTWQPNVLCKARLQTPGISAATQEDEIDWQTEELTFSMQRDDTETHDWRKQADAQDTEAAAEAVLKAMLNITDPPAGGGS